ncbi:MAG: 16S rRNA (cytidine(1402)-2'-O)-methyltransferase [Alphaproteobacteria bacterium]|nr:16S rRNA (cytidine(1402)-2'-O)-methyltransferase [Alphaproteobacteria bacterium]
MKNGIYIVATPIGNVSDISARATEILREADIIACEDSRMTKKLLSLLGISSVGKTFIKLEDHTEAKQADKIIELAKQKAVILVSDAGSPLISDPGYKLIRRCREEDVHVCVVPGACALICALQLSGLPTNSFLFSGFIPNKDKARRDLFNKLKDIDATLVFYETANRIIKTLVTAAEIFGNREVAVAREITKVYEECLRGTAKELITHFETKEPRGEMVFMVAPPDDKANNILDVKILLHEELKTNSLKTAVKNLVSRYGLNKNEVYQQALKIKDE